MAIFPETISIVFNNLFFLFHSNCPSHAIICNISCSHFKIAITNITAMSWIIFVFLQRSLCSEMAQELRFAVKCVGSSRKPKFKRRCSKCKKGKDCDDASHVCDVPLTDSANGIIQLRDVRRSPGPSTANRRYNSEFSRPKDYSGEYLHVDYSDGEV